MGKRPMSNQTKEILTVIFLVVLGVVVYLVQKG